MLDDEFLSIGMPGGGWLQPPASVSAAGGALAFSEPEKSQAQIKKIIESAYDFGAEMIVTPSSYKDLEHPELRPLLDRYYRGSDSSAEQRIKLFKLIWDAIGTEFGGRHELYERNYSGNNEQIRLDVLTFAKQRGIMDECYKLVEQCMSDYDLKGWTSPTWTFDPEK